jgi:hypothetical protein
MAINHEVRSPAFAALRRDKLRGFGEHDGMAGGRANPCIEADVAAMIGKPPGAGAQIFFMMWLRGDAGKAQKYAQFGDKAILVAFQVIEHNSHGD